MLSDRSLINSVALINCKIMAKPIPLRCKMLALYLTECAYDRVSSAFFVELSGWYSCFFFHASARETWADVTGCGLRSRGGKVAHGLLVHVIASRVLGHTCDWRLPDSAEYRPSLPICATYVWIHTHASIGCTTRPETSFLRRHSLGALWNRRSLVVYARAPDREDAAVRRSRLGNGSESLINDSHRSKFWPRKRNEERKELSVSFTPTPLECFSFLPLLLTHTCNLWP